MTEHITTVLMLNERPKPTALEIAILVLSLANMNAAQAYVKRDAYYLERVEHLVKRYHKGLSFKDISNECVHGQVRCRQLVESGMRLLRHPARRKIWRMLIAERTELCETRLFEDVFGGRRIRV